MKLSTFSPSQFCQNPMATPPLQGKKLHILFDKSGGVLYIHPPTTKGGKHVKKALAYLIGILVGLVVLLATALGIFIAPLFQADQVLAQIRVDDVVDDNCYLVSLELTLDNDKNKREPLISREPICGDFLGLGYEFALPEKTFALMQKPGIVITNVVAFDKKTYDQTGNIRVGNYKIELIETLRDGVGRLLQNSLMFKSITYDIKTLTKKPKKGAVISYNLEPFRQHVIVECTGCEE